MRDHADSSPSLQQLCATPHALTTLGKKDESESAAVATSGMRPDSPSASSNSKPQSKDTSINMHQNHATWNSQLYLEAEDGMVFSALALHSITHPSPGSSSQSDTYGSHRANVEENESESQPAPAGHRADMQACIKFADSAPDCNCAQHGPTSSERNVIQPKTNFQPAQCKVTCLEKCFSLLRPCTLWTRSWFWFSTL